MSDALEEEKTPSEAKAAVSIEFEKPSLSFDIEENLDLDESTEDEGFPYGQFCTALCLLIIGLAFIIGGFIEENNSPIPAVGVPFWVIGALILLPGLYCSFEIARALRSSPEERRRILREVPEI
mmetsp:Transcript_6364/g.11073  ORF Transcript_6364/g.11073 Transcript_6364/m.11073 type:complete len:124 (+) Transcript_6364:548-919(+)|eukprot:CAMPEP_0204905706 /NCGR_PEP_ID=MMETSP1397-20131031/5571_1 /ASSEMBLY_ACC=CAM_ASM_000891 /TAXON_ID=49980 /ORGANISM="Climacostomum Climacostomum virens, Strain Stock W-24" /LENGTH=123 /DNA_ID=CAMNT_0052074619 /DNA_START=530 /DNA_END=901 /DNA_ORIENTATION=-